MEAQLGFKKGVDLRHDTTKVEPDASPDCMNVRHYQGRIGTLGARGGRTIQQALQTGTVRGIIKLALPSGNRWLIAYDTPTGGQVDDQAALF